jgi:hypothetical protein
MRSRAANFHLRTAGIERAVWVVMLGMGTLRPAAALP